MKKNVDQGWSDTHDDDAGQPVKQQASERDPKPRQAIYLWSLVRQLPWLILRYRL